MSLRRYACAVSAGRIITETFPATTFLSANRQNVLRRLPGLGITGGAVYDALVAEVARVCGVPLVTDDRLVLGTYASIGCTPQLLT